MATYYGRGGTANWTNASTANWASSATAATFTASRSGTTLTVTAGTQPAVGDTVWHTNGTSIGIILSDDGGGNYTMDTSGTVTSRTMSSATIGAGPTTSADDVVIDADSNVGTATWTLTLGATAPACNNFTASGLDAAMTLGFSANLSVHGNWSIPAANFIIFNTLDLIFAATSGTKTITSNGVSYTCDRIFNGVGGTWQLQDACSGNKEFQLVNGTLDLNNQTLTCLTGAIGTAATTLAFGTGKIVVTGNNGVIWLAASLSNFTVTGTPIVELTYSGATGTRTIQHGQTAGATEARSVTFKVLAGTDTVAFTGTSLVRSLDFTGFAGTLTNTAKTIYGGVTLATGMTMTAGANVWTFAATSGTHTINSAGKTIDNPVTFNGAGGTWALGADLTIGSTRLMTQTNGNLNLAGFTCSTGTWASGTGTKNITFNGGTLIITGAGATAFNNAQPTNFTTTAGTGVGTITMAAATAKTFVGAGSTFNCVLRQSGAGDLSITGSNTFVALANDAASGAILFTAGTTTTFTDASEFDLDGVSIASVTGAPHTLSCPSGTITVQNCTITNSHAEGGATWIASVDDGNVDGGGNTGWNFSGAGGGGGGLTTLGAG